MLPILLKSYIEYSKSKYMANIRKTWYNVKYRSYQWIFNIRETSNVKRKAFEILKKSKQLYTDSEIEIKSEMSYCASNFQTFMYVFWSTKNCQTSQDFRNTTELTNTQWKLDVFCLPQPIRTRRTLCKTSFPLSARIRGSPRRWRCGRSCGCWWLIIETKNYKVCWV